MRSIILIPALLLIGCRPFSVRQTWPSPNTLARSREPLHLSWDHVALDITGAPAQISTYTVAVTQPYIVTLAVRLILKTVDVAEDGGHRVALDTFLAELPAGEYRLWVQAVDTSGNRSAWSAPLTAPWDGAAPAIPAEKRGRADPS